MILIIYIALGVAFGLFIFANLGVILQIVFDLSKAVIFVSIACIAIVIALIYGKESLEILIVSSLYWGPPLILVFLYVLLAVLMDKAIEYKRRKQLQKIRDILAGIQISKQK